MNDHEDRQQIYGSSGGESIGSVPLAVLMAEIEKRTQERFRAMEDRSEAWRRAHQETHVALTEQLRVDATERRLRDAGQNEWRATVSDITSRLPSRDMTDALNDRIVRLELAQANLQGRIAVFGVGLTVLMFVIGLAANLLK